MRKKDFWLILTAVVAALVLAVGQFMGAAVTTGAWGLSFPSAGAAPNGPADTKTLQAYDAAYVGDPSEKVLYLTFDAGYENGCTEKILDTLKKHDVKAVFFLVGNYLEKNADLVRRMVDEGHIVGNHTMTHPDMSAITDKTAFEKELKGQKKLIRRV
jgi:peptidoglycan-N-acetylmuramic acid deacetylase